MELIGDARRRIQPVNAVIAGEIVTELIAQVDRAVREARRPETVTFGRDGEKVGEIEPGVRRGGLEPHGRVRVDKAGALGAAVVGEARDLGIELYFEPARSKLAPAMN